MALLEEHEKYHKLGPKDVLKEGEPAFVFDISRTTTHTGEQLHASCPVYLTDSREEIETRLQFCYSIIQDRMEQENVAINRANEKAQRDRLIAESLGRNKKKYEADIKRLQKAAKKEGWTLDKLTFEEKELSTKFNEAQETLMDSNPIELVGDAAELPAQVAEAKAIAEGTVEASH